MLSVHGLFPYRLTVVGLRRLASLYTRKRKRGYTFVILICIHFLFHLEQACMPLNFCPSRNGVDVCLPKFIALLAVTSAW